MTPCRKVLLGLASIDQNVLQLAGTVFERKFFNEPKKEFSKLYKIYNILPVIYGNIP